MRLIAFILIIVFAVLASVAVTGWVVYMLVKRYFDNEQKERLLRIKMDERAETLRQRMEGLYEEDAGKPIRLSHENPDIKKLYAEFLGEPGSEKAHHLLHTVYHENKRD